MATAPAQQPQDVAPGRGQATIAYSSYIEQQLGRTRKQVKWVEIATHVVTLLVGLLSALLVIAVIDHWIKPLGTLGRWICLLGILAGGGYYATRVILPLLLRRVNAVYAALAIEQNLPSLKNSLVNLLLLRNSDVAPPAVLEAVEAQAASRLAQVDTEVHVDRSRLIRLGYVLIGVMALGAIYKFFSPKDPLQTFQRVFSPWAAISAPTRVQIARVTPGDTQIFTDQHVELQAVVHNLRGEPVEVVYSSVDAQRRINQRRITLRETSPGVFETLLPGGVDGLQESVRYYIQAGDARSPEFLVTVRTPPAITVRQVEYKYPEYTGRERPPSEGGDVQALVGTVVTLRAEANQEIREAWLDLNCDGRADLRMQSQGRTASVSFPLRLSERPGERNRPEHDSYQIRYVNSEGHENPRPIRYKINVIPDDPPQVSIRQPSEKLVEVPVNGQLAVTVAAEDPDFALSRVTVLGENAKASGRLILKQNLLEKIHPGKFEGQYAFVPQEHKLQAGDEVQLWALAFDNKQPEAQSTKSDLLRIKIVDPAEQQGEPPTKGQPQQGDQQKPDQNNNQQANQNQQGKQEPNGQNQQQGQGQGQNQQGANPQGQPQEGNQQGQTQGGQPAGDQNQKNQNGQDQQNGQHQQQQPGQQQPGANQKQPGEPQQNAEGQPDQKGEGENQPQQGMNDPAAQGDPMKPAGEQPGNPMQGDKPQQDGQQPEDGAARNDQQQQQPGAQPENQQGSEKEEPVDPQRDPGKVIQELLKHRENQEPEKGNQSQDQQQQPGNQNQGNQDQQPGNMGGQQQGGQQNAADRHQPGGDNQQAAPQGGDPQAGGGGQQGQGQNNPNQQSQSPSSDQPGEGDKPSDQRGNSTQKGGGQQQGGGKERPDGKDDNTMPSGLEKPENGESANGQRAGKMQSQESRDTPDAEPKEGTDAQGEGGRTKPNQEKNMNPPEGQKDANANNKGGDASQEKGAGGAGNPEGGDKGSPEPYENAKPKRGKSDDQGPPQTPNDANNPQSPSNSKNESDSQSDSSGDRSGGGKDGGGQAANQKGTGGAGQNTAADEGASQAPGSGRGEDSAMGGNKTEADGQTGQAGERAGAGSQSRQGESSQGQGTTGQNPGQQMPDAKGQPQKNQQQQQAATGKREQQASPNEQGQPDEGGGIGTNRNGQPGPTGAGAQSPSEPGMGANPPHNNSEPGGEDPNLQYANQATDLALRHLREELAKENPDPNLLKRINMSKAEAQEFLRRMEQDLNKAKQAGVEGEIARNRLRNLGLRPSSGGGQDDALRGLRESAVSRPPAAYREEYRSYTERGVRPSRKQ